MTHFSNAFIFLLAFIVFFDGQAQNTPLDLNQEESSSLPLNRDEFQIVPNVHFLYEKKKPLFLNADGVESICLENNKIKAEHLELAFCTQWGNSENDHLTYEPYAADLRDYNKKYRCTYSERTENSELPQTPENLRMIKKYFPGPIPACKSEALTS